MRVFLATRYFDFRNAGVGRVSSRIKEGLEKRGIEVLPFSTEGTSLSSYFRYSVWEMRRNVKNNLREVDIFHSLTPVEGLWMPPERTVVTYHDFIPVVYPKRGGAGIGQNPVTRLVGKVFFDLCSRRTAKAAALCCVSNQTASDLINLYKVKRDKIRVIRLGINPELAPSPRNTSSSVILGYLGQLDRRKRVDLLIKAVREAQKVNLILLIAGTGKSERYLRELSGDDKRIKFLGALPDSTLGNFYNSLDFFVFPTWAEGYGLPLVEAMACKVPVVTLEDSIIPEEVKKRTIVVVDLLKFVQNIESLRSWESLGVDLEGNYQFAKAHSWDSCVGEYIEVYKEVCKG